MPEPTRDEPVDRAAICIRVMEAFFARVDRDDRFNALYMDLWTMYGATLQEELAPLAFELAVEAFGSETVVLGRRMARDAKLSAER
jgi:hypothetical protein